jgi:hypothetical protein
VVHVCVWGMSGTCVCLGNEWYMCVFGE